MKMARDIEDGHLRPLANDAKDICKMLQERSHPLLQQQTVYRFVSSYP